MDFLKKQAENFSGGNNNSSNNNENQNLQSGSSNNENSSSSSGSGGGGGFLSGLGDKFNSAAGGGKESEKNEDYLDKAIDMAQEKFMGGGDQSNESAVEQAKDEQISDFIRGQYKSMSGSDLPVKDKPTTFDKSTD